MNTIRVKHVHLSMLSLILLLRTTNQKSKLIAGKIDLKSKIILFKINYISSMEIGIPERKQGTIFVPIPIEITSYDPERLASNL